MKPHHLLFALLLSSVCNAQTELDIHTFNKKYLEHLVKTGVDSVRKAHKCEPLINDSILYVASSHHAYYLLKTGKLSHTEDNSDSTKTPQDRAEHYGAVNYRVGENILFTPYNAIVEGKNKGNFDTHSYQGIANAMVSAWVHSPGHFKNIITADYQLTGLSVEVDTIKKRIYACQKFAVVDYQYSFKENKAMFPYSNYTPPQPVNSFDGISRQLIKGYKYDYDLRHDKPEYCLSCELAVANPPPITLRLERNMFILRVEDGEYVKNLMDDKHDGFAVEIVRFDDYMCGNPAYYTKPGRRNGQLMLNGKILKPLLRDDLLKGYKKRTIKKDVKFIPYIFNSDSVKFFKRFGKYKLDRFNAEYFEIPLGKVPTDVQGLWSHNLVYIQDGQICHIDYFTSYCGEMFEEYQTVEFIPCSPDYPCYLEPEERHLHFSIPFEQGKSDFTKADINPFIQSISNLTYDVDSVRIHAYSSIEGDSVLNRNLQIMRSKNIAAVLKNNQHKKCPVRITTSADWEGFYTTVAKNPKWKYLASMSKTDVLKELNKTGYDEIESILKAERRGEIDLYCTIEVNDHNLQYFLTKELDSVQHNIDSLTAKKRLSMGNLNEFTELYQCIHSKVAHKKISPDFLANIKMPRLYRESPQLIQFYIMYGYEFREAFEKTSWKSEHIKDEEYFADPASAGHLNLEVQFLLINNAINAYRQNNISDQKVLQDLLNNLSALQYNYQTDSIAQLEIDWLNFNINMLLLNTVFAKDKAKYSGDAIKSIAQLQQFYDKRHTMNAEKAIKLGKAAVYFEQIENAFALMSPYATNDSVLAYILQLAYQHVSSPEAKEWYDALIDASVKMDEAIWCNMLMDECKIPFQAFDCEPLRSTFCEKCLLKNDFVKNLINKNPIKQ